MFHRFRRFGVRPLLIVIVAFSFAAFLIGNRLKQMHRFNKNYFSVRSALTRYRGMFGNLESVAALESSGMTSCYDATLIKQGHIWCYHKFDTKPKPKFFEVVISEQFTQNGWPTVFVYHNLEGDSVFLEELKEGFQKAAPESGVRVIKTETFGRGAEATGR